MGSIIVNRPMQQIIPQYRAFAVDYYGPIRDCEGVHSFAPSAIMAMQNQGEVFLFSNTCEQSATRICKDLKKDLIDIPEENIITSGMALERVLGQDEFDLRSKNNIFCVGNKTTEQYIEMAGGYLTKNVKTADVVVIGHALNTRNQAKFRLAIEIGRRLNPVILPNTDRYVPISSTMFGLGAGYISDILTSKYNLNVIEVGKPEKFMYDILKSKLSNLGIPFNKVLAIGDTIETDIKGANSNGFDSMLLTFGVEGLMSKENLFTNINLRGIFPKFVLNSISLKAKP